MLLSILIQNICFRMINCPHTLPEGDEEWRQSGADSGWLVELRPGVRSSLQLMHSNLPRIEAAMLTTESERTLGDSERERHWHMEHSRLWGFT